VVKSINIKSEEIQKRDIDAEIAQIKVGKLSAQADDFNLFEESREGLKVVLSSEQEVDFIKGIEELADKTGNSATIKIKESAKKVSKKEDEATPAEGIMDKLPSQKYISADITLEGNYYEMLDFLKKLENFQYYLTMVSINSKAVDERLQNSNSYFSNNQDKTIAKKFVRTVLETVAYIKE